MASLRTLSLLVPAVRGETLRSRLDRLTARHELPLLPILEAAYGQLNNRQLHSSASGSVSTWLSVSRTSWGSAR